MKESSEGSWVDCRYEALEFFYWEPQHLGRKKYVDATLNTAAKVRNHLRKMEVTLNQDLQQFFRLAPRSLRLTLMGRLFGESFTSPMKLFGRDVDQELALDGSTQPDLLFVSDEDVASVEMKIGSKANVDQVLKYALLGLAVERRYGERSRHCLAFLGTGDFKKQFEERFQSLDKLKEALSQADFHEFLGRMPKRFRDGEARLRQIVVNLRLSYITYEELASDLLQQVPEESDPSLGAEVYRRLILGIVDEIEERRL